MRVNHTNLNTPEIHLDPRDFDLLGRLHVPAVIAGIDYAAEHPAVYTLILIVPAAATVIDENIFALAALGFARAGYQDGCVKFRRLIRHSGDGNPTVAPRPTVIEIKGSVALMQGSDRASGT
jgi:hypothetical protein